MDLGRKVSCAGSYCASKFLGKFFLSFCPPSVNIKIGKCPCNSIPLWDRVYFLNLSVHRGCSSLCFPLYVRILPTGSPAQAIPDHHLRVEVQRLQSLMESFRVKAGFATCLSIRIPALIHFLGSEKAFPFVQAQ